MAAARGKAAAATGADEEAKQEAHLRLLEQQWYVNHQGSQQHLSLSFFAFFFFFLPFSASLFFLSCSLLSRMCHGLKGEEKGHPRVKAYDTAIWRVAYSLAS